MLIELQHYDSAILHELDSINSKNIGNQPGSLAACAFVRFLGQDCRSDSQYLPTWEDVDLLTKLPFLAFSPQTWSPVPIVLLPLELVYCQRVIHHSSFKHVGSGGRSQTCLVKEEETGVRDR